MRKYYKYIAWLILFLSCKASKEVVVPVQRPPAVVYVPYTVNWTTTDETFVIEYRVQRNRTKNNSGWETIDKPIKPIKATMNSYALQLPKTSTSYYYRVIANIQYPIKKGIKKDTYSTAYIYLPNTNLK